MASLWWHEVAAGPPAGVGLPEHGPTPWQILAASMVPGTQQMLQNRWPEEGIRERADSDLIQSKLTQINACFFHADATKNLSEPQQRNFFYQSLL